MGKDLKSFRRNGEPKICLRCGGNRFKDIDVETEDIGVIIVKDYAVQCRQCGEVVARRKSGKWEYKGYIKS